MTNTANLENSNNNGSKNRMLFSLSTGQELQAAIVKSGQLTDFDVSMAHRSRLENNIYLGKITSINKGNQACFVHYSNGRQGFLPWSEIDFRSVAKLNPDVIITTLDNKKISCKDILESSYIKEINDKNIGQYLRDGMKVLVQVEKDERDHKGASLTTRITLAGRYLILNINPTKPGNGVSRRIENRQRRKALLEAMSQLKRDYLTKEMSLIARSAAEYYDSINDLKYDIEYLTTLWKAIQTAQEQCKSLPLFILEADSLVIRFLRDNLTSDIHEIWADDENIMNQIKQFAENNIPSYDSVHQCIQFYDTSMQKDGTYPSSLFNKYQIQKQIEYLYSRKVSLPSGATIVIDRTEAMCAIDVNSAKFNNGANSEVTAKETNLEAAVEIARQIRLRDIGGIIAIDFIDMRDHKSQAEVIATFNEARKGDRAKITVASELSRFGVLELSRERLQASLSEYTNHTCPRCSGEGFIPTIESNALQILRDIETMISKESVVKIYVYLPVETNTYLNNEHYQSVAYLRGIKTIHFIPQNNMQNPAYKLIPITRKDLENKNKDKAITTALAKASYELINTEPFKEDSYKIIKDQNPSTKNQEPVIKSDSITVKGSCTGKEKIGILTRLSRWFKNQFGSNKKQATITQQPSEQKKANIENPKSQPGTRKTVARPTKNSQSSNKDKGNSTYKNKRNTNKKRSQPSQNNKPVVNSTNMAVSVPPTTIVEEPTVPIQENIKENKEVIVKVNSSTTLPMQQPNTQPNSYKNSRRRGKAPQYSGRYKGKQKNFIPESKEIVKRINYYAILNRITQISQKIMVEHASSIALTTQAETITDIQQACIVTTPVQEQENTSQVKAKSLEATLKVTEPNNIHNKQPQVDTPIINLGGLQLIETKPQPDNAEPIIEPITTGKRRLDLPKIEEVPLQDTPLIQVETNKFD